MTHVTGTDSEDRAPPTADASRLLEQMMQIARTSALEEMASGIAHELNQPIGAITTFAQTGERMLGRTEPLVSDAREVLHYISTEALKAGQGIRRIRSLFERQNAARTACDMGEVVEELLPVLRLFATRTGSSLQVDIQAGLPKVSIDRLRIQHVLFALVQNALETPCRAGAEPRVGIDVAGDRYAVLLTVSDAGGGVPADVRDHLFRPFFTTKDYGTGLGLASSRAIVEAHEGTIGFDNIDGGGARFWFRLPATSGEV